MKRNKIQLLTAAIALLAPLLTMQHADAQPTAAKVAGNPYIAKNDVTWTSLGKDENDSMPLGNGRLAANVWTEQNGDLVLLLSSPDTWTETGKLVKLGRVRVKLSENPFAGNAGFNQTLKLGIGEIEIKNGNNTLQVWIDANRPVVHLEAHLDKPAAIQASLEMWRKTKPFAEWTEADQSRVMSGEANPPAESDVIFLAGANQISWCHFNPNSYYPFLMRQEHLESLIASTKDPLYHRCFGAAITGAGLVSTDNISLKSKTAAKDLSLAIVALIQPRAVSPASWKKDMDARVKSVTNRTLAQDKQAHQKWWQDFWNRSWINVSGKDETANVSQGYVMQRYMLACSSRGEIPAKFNGGVFTVGHDIADTVKQRAAIHDADYRAWGDSYWNQNNRLLYWPLIATGDTDLIKPWYNMYLNALPLAKGKNQLYYHHAGASYPETMHFWGISNLGDFGKNNPTNEIQSHWQKYHVQGTLEVIAQMLDTYDYGHDNTFAAKALVPFADEIITFYGQHWPRDANGKILMSPSQSLETYQLTAVNPTPDIAGLMSVIPRMLALSTNLTTAAQRAAWAKTLNDLPPIPIGRTAKGKLPPLGDGDPDGTITILPAEKYGKPGNGENPELYVAFPYRIFGVGKPNLELAKNTFAARRSPQNTCWGQDGTQAAVLGLTSIAQKAAIAEFNNYGDQRFKWFWKPGHDWIPDLDNGGDGMITLQNMLMQCDDKRIQLLPAWPADWTADFKLNAPYQTTVQGHVENGKVTNLVVTPAARIKDVVMVKAGK
ncbi:hypothetical protein HQ865_13710 [Mucilaginibacter mali]|uniref:Uncharacterized protein n=1 Tax=Mucilaginibacter mali TaxID=2740462 RepID=A0A7D4PV64_9SPHI|nr:DUF5703 domain-containing protein [Mucilaginibacter mali]QKJ30763.1 hypothetical protein HQ865_13710 [Mucilaginibacter mali]